MVKSADVRSDGTKLVLHQCVLGTDRCCLIKSKLAQLKMFSFQGPVALHLLSGGGGPVALSQGRERGRGSMRGTGRGMQKKRESGKRSNLKMLPNNPPLPRHQLPLAHPRHPHLHHPVRGKTQTHRLRESGEQSRRTKSRKVVRPLPRLHPESPLRLCLHLHDAPSQTPGALM